MIEVDCVSRQFGSIAAVKDVSFKVERGEVVGFLGPNGAGKTTMMRILTCFIPPSSGTAKVDGLDVTRHSLEVRRKIGYFLERVALYPDMRVFPFLRFAAEVKGVGRSGLTHAVHETMENVRPCAYEGSKSSTTCQRGIGSGSGLLRPC